MEAFLLGTYQTVGVLLFLFLSSVLIYHKLFRRWLKFGLGFFVVYGAGSYFFFRRWPVPFPASGAFEALPYFLFFFGCFACIGYCEIRQLALAQSIGVLACYFVLLLAFLLLTGIDIGLPREGSVQTFLAALPYVLFFGATPIVLGLCLIRGLGIRETAGVFMTFAFALVLLLTATSSYFGRPFGFAPELSAYTRAWIEVGSLLIAALGVPVVLGAALLGSLTLRETLGAVTVFLAASSAVVVLVYLTIGYEVLGNALGAR